MKNEKVQDSIEVDEEVDFLPLTIGSLKFVTKNRTLANES